MNDWTNILPVTIAALRAGRSISLGAPSGRPVVLSVEDIPTLERALQAASDNEVAWIGFRLVNNREDCMGPGDERFATGSACDRSFVFFADVQGQLVCGHPFNDRDRFQMLDITRGPSMHAGQFAGLTWEAIPLKRRVRVVVFGAGQVSRHLADFAHAVEFDTLVLDDDPAFLNAERFPHSALLPVDFTTLEDAPIEPEDFCCVLTRNHTHDVEALARALQADPAYVGMIGHPDKIRNNYEVLRAQGASDEAIAGVHAPIGIKCGGRTPAEIAISIVAQLIQERRNLG